MSNIELLINSYFQEARKLKHFNDQMKFAKELAENINKETKNLENNIRNDEAFNFNEIFFTKIYELVASSDIKNITASLFILKYLLENPFFCNIEAFHKSVNYIRQIIHLNTLETKHFLFIASVYEVLLKAMGPVVSEIIDFEVDRLLTWMDNSSSDNLKYVSVLFLKELVSLSPTAFDPHVHKFLAPIWIELRHPKQHIRETAVSCLSMFLKMISKKETKQRNSFYKHIYKEAINNFQRDTNESIFSSISVIRELIKQGGDFMIPFFKEAGKTILSYKYHRERQISRTVVQTIPLLASYLPGEFSKLFLDEALEFLFASLKSERHKDIGYRAIGEIVLAVKGNIKHNIKDLVDFILEALVSGSQMPSNKSVFLSNVYECISVLAEALESKLSPFLSDIINNIFLNVFNEDSISALYSLHSHIPEVKIEIENKLSTQISEILRKNLNKNKKLVLKTGKTQQLNNLLKKANEENPNNLISVNFFKPSGSLSSRRKSFLGKQTTTSDSQVILALKTLRSFELFEKNVLSSTRSLIVPFLDNEDVSIRIETVLSCTKLLYRACKSVLSDFERIIIFEILERIITTGISDSRQEVRLAVFSKMYKEFDLFLSQEDFLQSLFIAINDEEFAVREQTMKILGRLVDKNPTFIYPAIRKVLIYLLSEIKLSKVFRRRDESAMLLGNLFISAPSLSRNYTKCVLEVLMPSLEEKDRETESVLFAIGALSKASKELMKPYFGKIVPCILKMLESKNSFNSREVALRTLRELFESTMDVIWPYKIYSNLLPVLIDCLKPDNDTSVRKEASLLLGFLGAWNPEKFNLIIESEKNAIEPFVDIHSYHYYNKDKKYFAFFSVNALIKILYDPGLSSFHDTVINTLTTIVRNTEEISKDVLPFIVKAVIDILTKSISQKSDTWKLNSAQDHSLSCSLFNSLIYFVKIAKTQIKEHLEDIFVLIKKFWDVQNEKLFFNLVILTEEISLSLNENFSFFLGEIVPLMLKTMYLDTSKKRKLTKFVLHGFRVFVQNLSDYLYLIIPDLLEFCEKMNTSEIIQKSALLTLCKICDKLDVCSFSSRILHCQIRLLNKKTENVPIILNTIFHVVFQLSSYQCTMFISVLDKVLENNGIKYENYCSIISKYLKNKDFAYRNYLQKVEDIELKEYSSSMMPDSASSNPSFYNFNPDAIKAAWNTTQRGTQDDWQNWLKNFSSELVKENPSPAIRNCYSVIVKYPPLAKELFNTAFVSTWIELNSSYQDDFIFNIESALSKSQVSHETVYVLLNLVEFMERCSMSLPIKVGTLGRLAEKINSHAKALHYKEMEFEIAPKASIKAMISIYNHLQQPESADGMLEFASKCNIDLEESWYEKLRRWESALEAYEKNCIVNEKNEKMMLGRLRCLRELGEWKRMLELSENLYEKNAENQFRLQLAPYGAAAAWSLSKWDSMEKFVNILGEENHRTVEGASNFTSDCSFYNAILNVNKNEFKKAIVNIERTRSSLDSELTSLVGENYKRAYPIVAKLQRLTELEEVIRFKKMAKKNKPAELIKKEKQHMVRIWNHRLKGCENNVNVWHQLLSVRSLVLNADESEDILLRYSSLCRKKGLISTSLNVISTILGVEADYDYEKIIKLKNYNNVKYVYVKDLWDLGSHKESVHSLNHLVQTLDEKENALKAKCLLRYGEWSKKLSKMKNETPNYQKILESFEVAAKVDPSCYKAFHAVALMHYNMSLAIAKTEQKKAIDHMVKALQSFFTSMRLNSTGKSFKTFQDALRIISILFKSGSDEQVRRELGKGFEESSVDIWLDLIPQIIARSKTKKKDVQDLIRLLLLKIAKVHPQALIYPLTVAQKSSNSERVETASFILDKMRIDNPKLVEQAFLVSREFIRVAILWPEICLEEIKEASRLYLNREYEPMFEILDNLHKNIIDKEATTLNEVEFKQAFGGELKRAYELMQKFRERNSKFDLNEAWGVYCTLFKQLQEKIAKISDLDFSNISPVLLKSKDLELLMPGQYSKGGEPVLIVGFSPKLNVINSKRKPRKLSIIGSDGRKYTFLLKGHEDLRQDERVMQLLGLVNTLFELSPETSTRNLAIQRYTVLPLSENTGLIEWVPNCDTIYELVRSHRIEQRLSTKTELEILKSVHPQYQMLPLAHKMYAFERVMTLTRGYDLRDILWLRSGNSELWFERRTNYTRSLAVMSMVGYMLGLGDRHPCNLMLDRSTGKVLHIDFGDCFEVSMKRANFPEKVPFRLTRMMVHAMGVSGVEGLFRKTCEAVMQVLRKNRNSLMAVLEAFVYDPLINWRLIEKEDADVNIQYLEHSKEVMSPIRNTMFKTFSTTIDSNRLKHENLVHTKKNKVLTLRSVEVMKRISEKLTGKDFGEKELNEKQQVKELIQQATSVMNLSQCYSGWCPFW